MGTENSPFLVVEYDSIMIAHYISKFRLANVNDWHNNDNCWTKWFQMFLPLHLIFIVFFATQKYIEKSFEMCNFLNSYYLHIEKKKVWSNIILEWLNS